MQPNGWLQGAPRQAQRPPGFQMRVNKGTGLIPRPTLQPVALVPLAGTRAHAHSITDHVQSTGALPTGPDRPLKPLETSCAPPACAHVCTQVTSAPSGPYGASSC